MKPRQPVRFVELAGLLIALILATATPSFAQAQAAPEPTTTRFEILDNSFLVEESFNQEAGVFQNIFGWTRTGNGAWQGTFTQEWPVFGMTHQFSYTLPFAGGEQATHIGGVLLNYRFQALQEGTSRPAFSPRLSVILPTGRSVDSTNRPGLQINLPFSKQVGDLYFHWNAGVTWLHGVAHAAGTTDLTTPQLAGSAIWRTTPLFHLMLETVVAFEQSIDDEQRVLRERIVTISPGFRRAWNLGDQQIVIGAAVPVSSGEREASIGALTYFCTSCRFGADVCR